MRPATVTKDLLRPADLGVRELRHLLRLAAAMKAAPSEWSGTLSTQTVACVFDATGAPADVSFEAAAQRLGALPVHVRPVGSQDGDGDAIAEAARVLAGYCAAIAVRTAGQDEVGAYAAAAGIPVINALTEQQHPCQALADLLTLRERFGRLDGLRLAFVGQACNVANSLIEACALSGIGVRVAAAPGCEPDPDVIAGARRAAARFGEDVEVMHDPRAAVAGADIVYTTPWSRPAEPGMASYRVDRDLLHGAAPAVVLMHSLPARRGEEVTAELIDGPRSLALQQAHNRLPVEQAVLHTLVTADWGS